MNYGSMQESSDENTILVVICTDYSPGQLTTDNRESALKNVYVLHLFSQLLVKCCQKVKISTQLLVDI